MEPVVHDPSQEQLHTLSDTSNKRQLALSSPPPFSVLLGEQTRKKIKSQDDDTSPSTSGINTPTIDTSDDTKPQFVEIRSHLSQFQLNSQPNSAPSSSHGSVPPQDIPSVLPLISTPQTQPEDPTRHPGRLVRGIRPPAQDPSLQLPPPLDSAISEENFDVFVQTIMTQPQQMGFSIEVIRSVWLGANGNNQAAFHILAMRYQEHTQRQRQLAEEQHRMNAYHAQQQHAYQQQMAQQSIIDQQRAFMQRYPKSAVPNFQPIYPNQAHHNQQQFPAQQYQSPYGRQPQQQYQQGHQPQQRLEQRPRQYASSYQPRPSGAQPIQHNTHLPRYSQPLPPSAPLRKRKPVASDSDGEENYSDNSADEFAGPDPRTVALKNGRALSFFNECSKEELMELASCNPTQATLVMKLRPFYSPDDFRGRTRKQKGVGNNMFDTYSSVMDGMGEVDKVLDDCEAIGRDLSAIMRIWAGADVASGGNGIGGQEQPDVGTNLIAIPEAKVIKAAGESNNPAVRAAFEGYLSKQPEGVPESIVLKDYQMLGVNWLALLYRRKTSCILADEMGLGKTAQVIALMSHLKSIGEKGPHLVIVPSSTLENWMREFSVFAPGLIVESYYGSQADRSIQRHELSEAEHLDVVVTTYNIATSSAEDQKFLRKKMEFKICVFDEGHQLKNSESKKYKELMGIKAKWRLLLTGTPLQNNLQELVSLLSFILPDQFRDANESLKAIFKVGPSAQANLLSRERVMRAKKMMTPFVLRRKKAQVLKDLPQKFERIEWCEMTPLQREVHSEAMTRSKKALMETADSELSKLAKPDGEEEIISKPKKSVRSGSKTGNKSNDNSGSNVLMDLRKASNHPMLFRRLYNDKLLRIMSKECLKEDEFLDRDTELIYEDMEVMTDFELHRFCLGYKHLKKYCLKNEEWMSAGKIIALQRMIPEMKARGDRILLFSQFTQVLEILEVVLETMGIKYLKLTGQTNVTDRQSMVDEYTNNSEITVFLLSTRAGGLGLNLTAANTVIMHDQDFNPHADKQAEDRSYRIGQVRDVTVIKLICKDSVEEMMRALATQKLQLDSEVSSTTQYPSGATSAEHGDNDQANSEKKMRTSLLSNLKRRFEDETQENGNGNAVGGSMVVPTTGTTLSPVKM